MPKHKQAKTSDLAESQIYIKEAFLTALMPAKLLGVAFIRQLHRLNMKVVYLGSMSRDVHSCTHWLRPRNSLTPPAFGLVLLGRCWSEKIDDISL
jgi:hypothetical protein